MTYLEIDFLGLFQKIITKEHYHKYYKRTIEISKLASQIMDGDNYGELVVNLRKREDDTQKKQRIHLTHEITVPAGNIVEREAAKMRRTQGVQKRNHWEEPNDEAELLLMENRETFYANQSLREYLFDKLEFATFRDPNSFLIFHSKPVMGQSGIEIDYLKVFPVIMSSENIRDYKYFNGNLQYLLVERARYEDQGGSAKRLSEFNLYVPGAEWHFIEYEKDLTSLSLTYPDYSTITIDIENSNKSRSFIYKEHENDTKEVPAIRLGAYLDNSTMQKIAVTLMNPAMPILKQLINIGSLEDLVLYLHAIPRRKDFVGRCDYTDEHENACDSGYITLEGKQVICPSCGGSGKKVIASEQDRLEIPLPDNFTGEDLFDLAKLSYVEQLDDKILQYLDSRKKDLIKWIVSTVLGQSYSSMSDLVRTAATATEIQLNFQSIYDTFQPYAELYSQCYVLAERIILQYNNMDEGFSNSFMFPQDYQFETVTDLLNRRKLGKDAGASALVLEAIDADLVQRITRNENDTRRVLVWSKWKPFKGLSDSMVAMQLSSLSLDDPDRILFIHFTAIQREIEHITNGLFYSLTYEKQKSLIDSEIETYKSRQVPANQAIADPFESIGG